MKITFHGGAGEVGRSCIEVQTKESRVLLDCGLKLTAHGSQYPIGVKDYNFDACIISHAHLDHTGGLPLFHHLGMNCSVYCTKTTKAITRILLQDAFKIGKHQGANLQYDVDDIYETLDVMKLLKPKEHGRIYDVDFELLKAGHIPGATSIYLNTPSGSLFYTGDIKLSETLLMGGAQLKQADVLICEATYGDREQHNRLESERKLIFEVKNTLKKGGCAIVSAFAVGRMQEVLMILAKEKWDVPIYIDGMGKKVNKVVEENPQSIRNYIEFKKALRKTTPVRSRDQRKGITKRPCIIVTTSGMLTGGPIIDYISKTYHDPKHTLFLTGYQGEGTNGRMLMEEGSIILDGVRKSPKFKVVPLEFSAHADQYELREIIKAVKPKKVILNHCDPQASKVLQEWGETFGFETILAKLNQPIIFNNNKEVNS